MSDHDPVSTVACFPAIGLVEIGNRDQAVIKWVIDDLPSIIPAEIRILSPQPLPSRYFDSRRGQFIADGILSSLAGIARRENVLCLGITGADIFSPGLHFVFGIACTGAALISTFRLMLGFYGMPDNEMVYRRRILTEAVHEIGHALGLAHCEHPGCVMYFSNWIGDTDLKGPKFCYRCRRRVDLSQTG